MKQENDLPSQGHTLQIKKETEPQQNVSLSVPCNVDKIDHAKASHYVEQKKRIVQKFGKYLHHKYSTQSKLSV